MTLNLNVAELKRKIDCFDTFRTVGEVHSAKGVVTARLPCAVGDLCHILGPGQSVGLAEVISVEPSQAQIMPFHTTNGLQAGTPVVSLGRPLRVPVGWQLLGRVVNAVGNPIDGGARVYPKRMDSIAAASPCPLERSPIRVPFVTKQRAIDSLLTLGRGQRVGLFSGSGVGKSTLLGEIAKGSNADLNVIALIGERGREIRPFLEECLGAQGMAKSVVVVSTADQAPLTRVRATQTAITIADYFRRQGLNVLFLLDSLTRLAMAQREIGLLQGEPPSTRGYTPSVFQLLSQTLEQLGNSSSGSITSILTVLVDGDEMDEPIADSTRAIVDGHIVLERRLAEKGHFPAININASISRVFRDVATSEHQLAARRLRTVLSTFAEVADLVRIGAYAKGASPQVDTSLEMLPSVELFLRQEIGDYSNFEDTRSAMEALASRWPF